MKNSGYFNGEIDWMALKETELKDFVLSNPTDKCKLDDKYCLKRNFFDGSKKNCLPFPRPLKTESQYLEYMMEGHDHPLKFATDNLASFPLAIRVTRNLFFYKAIRDNLQRLFEAGFMSHHFSFLTEEDNPLELLKLHEKQKTYSTLVWDQLYPGFYLWLGALIACVVVFILEFIVHQIYNRRK